MNRRKWYLSNAGTAELMAAESEDDLVLETSDSDIYDPSYIYQVPAHAL